MACFLSRFLSLHCGKGGYGVKVSWYWIRFSTFHISNQYLLIVFNPRFTSARVGFPLWEALSPFSLIDDDIRNLKSNNPFLKSWWDPHIFPEYLSWDYHVPHINQEIIFELGGSMIPVQFIL